MEVTWNVSSLLSPCIDTPVPEKFQFLSVGKQVMLLHQKIDSLFSIVVLVEVSNIISKNFQ